MGFSFIDDAFSTDLTADIPGTAALGDLLIVEVSDFYTVGTPSATPPAGGLFTELATIRASRPGGGAGQLYCGLWAKKWDGDTGNLTWTTAGFVDINRVVQSYIYRPGGDAVDLAHVAVGRDPAVDGDPATTPTGAGCEAPSVTLLDTATVFTFFIVNASGTVSLLTANGFAVDISRAENAGADNPTVAAFATDERPAGLTTPMPFWNFTGATTLYAEATFAYSTNPYTGQAIIVPTWPNF